MKTVIEKYIENGKTFYWFWRNGTSKMLSKSQYNFLINQLSVDKVTYIYQSPLGGASFIEYKI